MHCEDENSEDDSKQFFEEEEFDDITLNVNNIIVNEEYKNSNAFSSYFESMKLNDSISATNLLADNVFHHRMIMKDNTTLAIKDNNQSYSYNIVISFRYDNEEFKDLLIDSEAANRSTEELDQLETLQKIDQTISLNRSIVGSTSFVFEINSTSSIEIIKLSTLMRTITFHIIQINTFFLLSLADMNRLEAFFNNITNEVIQINRKHSVIRRYDHAFLA